LQVASSIPSGFGSNFGTGRVSRHFSNDFSLVFASFQPIVAARETDRLFLSPGASLTYCLSSTKVCVKNAPGLDDERSKLEIDGFAAGWDTFLASVGTEYRFTEKWTAALGSGDNTCAVSSTGIARSRFRWTSTSSAGSAPFTGTVRRSSCTRTF
jgi:hypothetical protein